MKRFTAHFGGIPLVLQINTPEHKDLYFSGQERNRMEDQIICCQELKLQLMAKSAICPGLITIIWSLITSNSTGFNDIEECSDELIEHVNNLDAKGGYYNSSAAAGGSEANANNPKAAVEAEARKVKDLDQINRW